jgi:long-chain acyl-CoA synthetase
MWTPLMLGASVIIVPRIERRSILKGLQEKPTVFFGVPALYGLMVMMRNAPLDSVKLFVSGADALPDKIRMAFALVYGRKIASGYGLTEASPVIAVDGSPHDYATNVVGTPVAGVSCEIRDKGGHALPIGMVGTLWVKGDNVMQGYHNEPGQTSAILVDGWLNTGDLASIDVEGKIAISGRCKDIIINKGFNIYPQEIENVLLRHPAVVKAAVVGKQDNDVGQIPVAYVAVRDGRSLTQEEVAKFCRQNLAAYKVPRSITCLEDLPMTATGKIDKKQLR